MKHLSEEQMLEKLLFAAIAAGIPVTKTTVMRNTEQCSRMVTVLYLLNGAIWNPLQDDGDAFRLENALQLAPTWSPSGKLYVVMWDRHINMHRSCSRAWFNDFAGDVNAARRYSVVMAAAEIGGA